MKKYIIRLCFFSVIGILFWSHLSLAYQSEMDEGHPFVIYFDDEEPLVTSHNKASVDLLFNIPEDHHLYRDSLRVKVSTEGVKTELVLPQGIIKFDAFRNDDVEIYQNQLLVLLKFTIAEGFDSSESIKGAIYYQGCSNKICYRTVKTPFTFTIDPDGLVIVSKEQPVVNQQAKAKDKSLVGFLNVENFQEVLNEGIWFAILLMFLAGLITSFTPCVLPIIPLTLAFIGVTQEATKRRKLFNLFVFVLGMSVMYAVLGVAAAALGLTFGFFYQSRIFLFLFSVFLLVMAFWLLGLIPISLSVRLQNKIVQYQPKGAMRFFYSGLTIGILAAPCVGPVLGPLLVYISSTQNLLMGFLLMQSYALGLSVLFFILGFFSNSWVGKMGAKTNIVKKLIGVLLLLTAAYFIWILAKPLVVNMSDEAGFFYRQIDVAQMQAEKDDKGLLIDFSADWCVPCHEWDLSVWNDPQVKKRLLEDFVPIKIDCTEETNLCKEAISRYGVIGWPTIIFLDKKGVEMKKTRIIGRVMEAKEFIKYLDEIKKEQ